MKKSAISEKELAAEVDRLKAKRAQETSVRFIIGLLFLPGAYLLFDASPNITDIPFAKLTLKDVGIGVAIFLGVWLQLGIALLLIFGWDDSRSGEQSSLAEAKGNILFKRGEVDYGDDD